MRVNVSLVLMGLFLGPGLLFASGVADDVSDTHVLRVMTYDSGVEFVEINSAMERSAETLRKELSHEGIDLQFMVDLVPPDDDSAKLKQALDFASGVAADILLINPPSMSEFVEAGYLLDLTDALEEWPSWVNYTAGAKASVTYKGRLYGLPLTMYASAISYRLDLFRGAGIDVPWQPSNLNDIVDTGLILKERYPQMTMPISIPIGTQWGISATVETILPIVWGNGDSLFNRQSGVWDLGVNGLTLASRWLHQLFIEHDLSSVTVHRSPDPWSTTVRMFSEGTNAMFISTTSLEAWAWGPTADYPLDNVDKQLAYAAFPGSGAADAPTYTGFSDSYIFVVNAASAIPEIAIRLLQLSHAADTIATVAVGAGALSPRLDSNDMITSPQGNSISWILQHTRMYPIDERFPEVDLLLQQLGDYILDGTNPDEALQVIRSRFVN